MTITDVLTLPNVDVVSGLPDMIFKISRPWQTQSSFYLPSAVEYPYVRPLTTVDPCS